MQSRASIFSCASRPSKRPAASCRCQTSAVSASRSSWSRPSFRTSGARLSASRRCSASAGTGAAGAPPLARVSTLAHTSAANLSRSGTVWSGYETNDSAMCDVMGLGRGLPRATWELWRSPAQGPSVKPPWEVKSRLVPIPLAALVQAAQIPVRCHGYL